MQNNSSTWQEKHNAKTKNKAYMEGMSPEVWPRDIVRWLTTYLSPWTTVFEYGVWPGANALYLKENGYEIEAQDVSDKMIEVFHTNIQKRGFNIPVSNSLAQEHVLEKNYDAFVSTYLLHFLPPEDAIKLIQYMQLHTETGGYHALEFFTNKNSHARSERFYPEEATVLMLYEWWKICEQSIWSDTNAEWYASVNMSILLQKLNIDDVGNITQRIQATVHDNL